MRAEVQSRGRKTFRNDLPGKPSSPSGKTPFFELVDDIITQRHVTFVN